MILQTFRDLEQRWRDDSIRLDFEEADTCRVHADELAAVREALEQKLEGLSRAIDTMRRISADIDAGYRNGVRDDDCDEACSDVIQAAVSFVGAKEPT